MLWPELSLSASSMEPTISAEMMNPAIRPKVRTVFFMGRSCVSLTGASCRLAAADVIILLDDFAGITWEILLWATRSGQQAEFFAALHRLGAARGTEFV